jgi:phosphate transport system substrate-binding protein
MSVKALLKPGVTTLAVMTKTTLVTAALAALMIPWAAQALDPSLPAYRPLETLSGHLKSVGSDTLGHEMEAWAKGFEKLYPDVKVEIEAAGSATAPLALLEGRSQFGPMSRPMTAEETAAFQDKYGYKISGFRVAVDALAVYVNKANPVACLTLPQLSGIFSSNRKTPGTSDVRTWGDLGLTSEWARQPITLSTRNTLSGTYEYFRETALYGGDYKPEIKQQSGSEAVVQAVAADKFGIGYSGIGYKNEGVRAVPLASFYGGTCHEAFGRGDTLRQIPDRAVFVCLHQPKAGPAARCVACRVREIHPVKGRSGANGAQRLLPDHE